MILNTTSEYRVAFLYLFWITTIFQTNILFKTNKCHHEGPLGVEGPGQLPPFNPALLVIPIMAFKFEGKEMCPIFVFANCCWSIHSKVVRLGKNAHNKQRKATPTETAVSRQVYVHALIVQHLYSVFFQSMVWYGPSSETAWTQRRQKNWSKYTDFTKLKNITIKIYLNKSWSNFVTARFVSLKNNLQLTVQVRCLFHFLLHSIVFKGKVKNGIFSGFYCWFLSGLSKTTGDLFWLGSITSTLKITMDV